MIIIIYVSDFLLLYFTNWYIYYFCDLLFCWWLFLFTYLFFYATLFYLLIHITFYYLLFCWFDWSWNLHDLHCALYHLVLSLLLSDVYVCLSLATTPHQNTDMIYTYLCISLTSSHLDIAPTSASMPRPEDVISLFTVLEAVTSRGHLP